MQNQWTIPGAAATLEDAYPVPQYQRVYVVVDNYKIHKAKAVEAWLAKRPRVTLLFLPTSCPHANPIERAFGDVMIAVPATITATPAGSGSRC